MLCVRNPTRPSPYKCMLSIAAVPLSPHNLLTPRPAPQTTHSECSLLCDDLHRLGYRRLLLDPSARVSYNMPTAWVLHSGAANLSALAALGTAPFSDVIKAGGGAAAGGAGYGAGVDWGADANIPAYSQVGACSFAVVLFATLAPANPPVPQRQSDPARTRQPTPAYHACQIKNSANAPCRSTAATRRPRATTSTSQNVAHTTCWLPTLPAASQACAICSRRPK